jgi:hypothetical protein
MAEVLPYKTEIKKPPRTIFWAVTKHSKLSFGKRLNGLLPPKKFSHRSEMD